MVVTFEFLGNEAIENVITCMHFKVDKVIYFGYHDVVKNKRDATKNFLTKYCGVQTVVFHELSKSDLQSVLRTMREEIKREKGYKSKIYFDVTGGESLLLVAFGMLSREFETPMHVFDVVSDKLIELDEGAKASISRDVETQKVELNLDRFIEMKGGVINWGLHKNIKEDDNQEFIDDVAKIWQISKKYIDYWNPFSDFLRANMVPDENLRVSKRARTVLNALSESTTKLKTVRKLNAIIDDLSVEGLLLEVQHSDGKYRFRFKNQNIKDCLWEAGSVLELHTFQTQKQNSFDCRVGVHLDWDGVIHPMPGKDVMNEIDVLSISGNVPSFISCKSGNMGAHQTLHALYELDAVARRFGGKYARKILVSAKELGDVYLERAAEMGIEVR